MSSVLLTVCSIRRTHRKTTRKQKSRTALHHKNKAEGIHFASAFHLSLCLIQPKLYRQRKQHPDGLDVLISGLPIRHHAHHPHCFLCQIRMRTSQHPDLTDFSVLFHHELHIYSSARFFRYTNMRIVDILRLKGHTCLFTSRKLRILLPRHNGIPTGACLRSLRFFPKVLHSFLYSVKTSGILRNGLCIFTKIERVPVEERFFRFIVIENTCIFQ